MQNDVNDIRKELTEHVKLKFSGSISGSRGVQLKPRNRLEPMRTVGTEVTVPGSSSKAVFIPQPKINDIEISANDIGAIAQTLNKKGTDKPSILKTLETQPKSPVEISTKSSNESPAEIPDAKTVDTEVVSTGISPADSTKTKIDTVLQTQRVGLPAQPPAPPTPPSEPSVRRAVLQSNQPNKKTNPTIAEPKSIGAIDTVNVRKYGYNLANFGDIDTAIFQKVVGGNADALSSYNFYSNKKSIKTEGMVKERLKTLLEDKNNIDKKK